MATRWKIDFIYAKDHFEEGHSLIGHGFVIDGIEAFAELMDAISKHNKNRERWCFMPAADGSSVIINLDNVNEIRIKDMN
jgi:hypothetical protein